MQHEEALERLGPKDVEAGPGAGSHASRGGELHRLRGQAGRGHHVHLVARVRQRLCVCFFFVVQVGFGGVGAFKKRRFIGVAASAASFWESWSRRQFCIKPKMM